MDAIDNYLKNTSPSQRAELERIREIVKRYVPDVEEMISYGLPAFKYKGRPLVYYGAFKNHMSLFPTSKPTEILSEKLKGYKVSKGTIQFTQEKPLPEALIIEIVQCRLDTM